MRIDFIEKQLYPESCKVCPFFGTGMNQKDNCSWHHKLFVIGKTRPDFCKVRSIKVLEEA